VYINAQSSIGILVWRRCGDGTRYTLSCLRNAKK
jgi:hypothetical protein